MTDSTNLIRIVQETQPDEIYNLAAQSHVQVSFETPEYTANADAIGTLRLLEAIRILGWSRRRASTRPRPPSCTARCRKCRSARTTPFYPRSPYAAAKLYAYWITVNYREAYGMHASNGILFNHESPLRGETFVTRKITRAAAAIQLGCRTKLYLGNLDAKRDWGHAREYVEGMWRMLQQDEPDDYVLATGETTTVRQFVEWAFADAGIDLEWRGRASTKKAIARKTGALRVAVDPRYFRPTEVDLLIGDPAKAQGQAGLEARRSACANWPARWSGRPRNDEKRTGGPCLRPMFDLAGKRVWVAGHKGMVGSAMVRRLASEGCEVLTSPANRRPDLAGRPALACSAGGTTPARGVPGRGPGRRHPCQQQPRRVPLRQPDDRGERHRGGESAPGREAAVPRLDLHLSQTWPSSRSGGSALLTGPLEPTNEWYAIAKIAGIKLAQAYRQQYGCDFISAHADQPLRPGRQFRPAVQPRPARADPQGP
jgi:GDPmannose 4,6-dehydratase